jgi:hypothetical protein
MKKLYVIPALAAFLATGSFAHAAALDDLILGFQSNNISTNLEIDVGPINTYFNTVGTYDYGNIASILTAYDASWATDGTLNWGVIGTTGSLNGGPDNEVAKTNWITQHVSTTATETLGVQNSTTPTQVSSAGSATAATAINKIYSGINGGTATPAGTNAITISTGDANAWSKVIIPGSSVATTLGTAVKFNNQPPTMAVGTLVSASDLYAMPPSGSGSVSFLGTFSLDQAGNFAFSTFTAIPEPSVYAAILGVACLAFVAIRRRKQQILA